MAKKITDNEIIKALDCLAGKTTSCYGCPYATKFDQPYCRKHVAEDVIRLINRKDARIKELEGKTLIQKGLIDRQKTEIEKLDEKFTIASEAIYDIEDALNRGSDNDWARETIKEYERLIAET